MEKDPGGQLELFSGSHDNKESSPKREKANYFSRNIWGYEKTILIIIALLVTGIISFSFGVEKGREEKRPEKETVVTASRQDAIPLEKEPELLKKVEAAVYNTGYTVQVASFKTDVYARKEVELLKKRGYESVTLKKGGHIIVCVGNFNNKEDAQALVSQLNRYYKDCRIRRL